MANDYGPEGAIRLSWGGELRFEAFTEETPFLTYLRVVDGVGREIAYWSIDEWKEDDGCVIGAVMGLAQNGPADDFVPNWRYTESEDTE